MTWRDGDCKRIIVYNMIESFFSLSLSCKMEQKLQGSLQIIQDFAILASFLQLIDGHDGFVLLDFM